MTPRRNRPKGARAPEPAPPLAPAVVTAPAGWNARHVSAARALKRYRCPGCQQWLEPGTAHVVAWQTDRDEERRHWHNGCWRTFARARR